VITIGFDLTCWNHYDVKSFATGITLGTGGNGSFAPSLFVGSYIGFVF
jgi:H+/Cl- antiporter ClcA